MGVSLDLSTARKAAATAPLNLSGLTRPQLASALVEAEVCAPEKARMRAGQLWRWIHHHGHTDFDRMTNVDKQTRAALADAVSSAVKEMHPYETPAILVIPLEKVDPQYLAWMTAETTPASPGV